MSPGVWDEQWATLKSIADQEEKLPSSSVEWAEAFHRWKRLDPEQKQKAIDYLRENEGMQVTHSTITSFLAKQIFLRPTPKARAAKKESELERRMREA